MKSTKWMKRFWKDFTTKEFIPLKILFFLLFGGMTTLFPFLTIQARSLGMTVDELGIIYGILPIVGVFGPALVGMCADAIGNFKIFLSIMMALSGLAALLFLLIPVGRVIHVMPEDLPLTLNCSRNSSSFEINEPLTCDYKNISEIEVKIKRCKYTCLNTLEPKLTIIGLNETWCSVIENCDLLRNTDIPTEIESYIGNANDTTLISNKFVSVSTKLRTLESTKHLEIPYHFCPDVQKLINDKEVYYFHDKGSEERTSPDCWLRCEVTTKTEILCSNSDSTELISPELTLALYIIIRLINGFALSSTFPLFEGAVIAILTEHKGDFGYQRMYGNLGMLIMTPISGKLIDLVSTATGKDDYRPAFYTYCGIKFICAFIIIFLNLEFKKPSKTVIKDVKSLILQPRVIAFLVFTLVSGICWGFVETFLFWLLDDMHADKSLMGLTVTFGAVFGLPLLMCSTYIIKRLGHIGTLSLSMSFFVIRLLGYSLIQNPWHAMPFEAMEAFTNSLKAVASVSYTAVLSSPTTLASLQGIYGGTYHGIGRGAGSLVGGFLIKGIGIRSTFQILAVVAGIASAVYFAVHWFLFRKSDIKKQNQEKIYGIAEKQNAMDENASNVENGIAKVSNEDKPVADNLKTVNGISEKRLNGHENNISIAAHLPNGNINHTLK